MIWLLLLDTVVIAVLLIYAVVVWRDRKRAWAEVRRVERQLAECGYYDEERPLWQQATRNWARAYRKRESEELRRELQKAKRKGSQI